MQEVLYLYQKVGLKYPKIAFENFFRSTFFQSPKDFDKKVKSSLLVKSCQFGAENGS